MVPGFELPGGADAPRFVWFCRSVYAPLVVCDGSESHRSPSGSPGYELFAVKEDDTNIQTEADVSPRKSLNYKVHPQQTEHVLERPHQNVQAQPPPKYKVELCFLRPGIQDYLCLQLLVSGYHYYV
ncbi:hypothetical protein NDU88_003478 [Pleurodeles waltl]|uniref:Uncharacterized protein n=1 Tax=Pleurodeles waltl TaxID=8319 RepID=A0AAV7WSJ3_PLEWA|nr:hypothetical protein NDU88_003478 [Pleurodeles waltl]